ncbi:STAS domain-containing protein [Mycobacterium sp. NPDC003323]
MTDSNFSYFHPTCTVVERWVGSTLIIDCTGALDVTTASVLESHICAGFKANPTAIVVDLSGLDFLAARGMNVLIGANTSLRGRIAFAVVADGPRTRRPMAILGLDTEVDMHTTVDTALASLGPSTAAAG